MKLVVSTTMPLKDSRGIEFSKNKKDVEIFRQVHGIISDSWLVDRLNKISLPFSSIGLSEYSLDFPIKNIDLDTACFNRSKELIASNKKIYVLWSGGIDSTLVVVSLLKAGIRKDQIYVVCNTDSQKENYNFFLKIINSVNIVSTERIMQTLKYQNLDGLILSAEHGDLSYGYDFSSEILQIFGPEYLGLPATRENITKYFTHKKLNIQSANCWYDIFMESVKTSPRTIDTVYDFSWWVGFNWRWQYALEKFRMRFYHAPDSTTFFQGHDIQNWAIHHQQPDLKTLKDFKPEYKKIILGYTGDENYYKNKIKHESTTLYYGSNSYAAVLENQTRINIKDFDLFSFYQENNFITDWLHR
jgi:signal peptidase I